MTNQSAFTLINPVTKATALEIFTFDDASCFQEIKPRNYYTIVLVTEGTGRLTADFNSFSFTAKTLMCFSVYQPFYITAESPIKGVLVHFHPDFFCIHKHQEEVACNGVLFNNIYQTPFIQLSEDNTIELDSILQQLKAAIQKTGIAQYELLVSYLKIFLISASRIRIDIEAELPHIDYTDSFILKRLKEAIEEHYRDKHSASDYAKLLCITPKALNRLTKTHFNRTLTTMITERVIIEAKRELYLTAKPVKSIAYELGFEDEFYFSRFFKNYAQVSPLHYRATVGFDRGRDIGGHTTI